MKKIEKIEKVEKIYGRTYHRLKYYTSINIEDHTMLIEFYAPVKEEHKLDITFCRFDATECGKFDTLVGFLNPTKAVRSIVSEVVSMIKYIIETEKSIHWDFTITMDDSVESQKRLSIYKRFIKKHQVSLRRLDDGYGEEEYLLVI